MEKIKMRSWTALLGIVLGLLLHLIVPTGITSLDSLVGLFGKSFALVILTIIVVWPFESRFKGAERDLKSWKVTYRKYFFSVFIAIYLISYFYSSSRRVNEFETAASTFTYNPDSSFYKIEFFKEPDIKQSLTVVNGLKIKNEVAEIFVGKFLHRAEYINLKESVNEFSSKEGLFNLIKQYAAQNQLTKTVFKFEMNPSGQNANVVGYKYIDGLEVMYDVSICQFKSTLFIVTIGGPSNEFPSVEAERFKNSIELNNLMD